jgi:hypothetical protein
VDIVKLKTGDLGWCLLPEANLLNVDDIASEVTICLSVFVFGFTLKGVTSLISRASDVCPQLRLRYVLVFSTVTRCLCTLVFTFYKIFVEQVGQA